MVPATSSALEDAEDGEKDENEAVACMQLLAPWMLIIFSTETSLPPTFSKKLDID
uniref:Uncharacterized protein n=1 Tax=Oryza brachyantha TaxID=4533 RepID=J3MRC4_ORYBR